MSAAELLLAVQLEQAGIFYEREVRFAPPRRWRADFEITDQRPPLLIEVEGGSFTGGHRRGSFYELDTEKASVAAILGYRVIRATPRQVEDGTCLKWIRQALGLEAAA